jgi:hypothetical protein
MMSHSFVIKEQAIDDFLKMVRNVALFHHNVNSILIWGAAARSHHAQDSFRAGDCLRTVSISEFIS